MKTDLSFAQEQDKSDSLAGYRQKFHIPENTIYLCGNSLGLQPVTARDCVLAVLDDWKTMGVGGHFQGKNPWRDYHETLNAKSAPLVGAKPDEVAVMNSLTVNLNFLMVSFYRPTPARHKIVIEDRAFPSDQYAVKSQISFHGFDPKTALIELKPRAGEDAICTEDIEALIEKEGDSIALIMLGGVNYYTGQMFDMQRITQAGHKKGCIVGFDLAHAVGNVALDMHGWDVDFAVWCSYKYLNAGPNGVGGAFVHERFAHATDLPRMTGWWGHDKVTRFKMGPDFHPVPGAQGWQMSNPPILALAALHASLDIFEQAGLKNLREKSMRLTGYLEFLLDDIKSDGFSLITPRDPGQRGCQISIRMKQNGQAVFAALGKAGVVCDWREPDCIRVAPAPLYNSFEDVWRFVQIFKSAL